MPCIEVITGMMMMMIIIIITGKHDIKELHKIAILVTAHILRDALI